MPGGFVQIPNEIIRGGHGGNNLAVLIAMMSHGKCWASIATIAKEVGCSRSTAGSAIKYWMDNGTSLGIVINRIQRKNGQTSIYEVSFKKLSNSWTGVSNKWTGSTESRPTIGHKEYPYKNTKEEASLVYNLWDPDRYLEEDRERNLT